MPRIPKEADIKKYLIDADIIEERKEKQKSGFVINPLSTLRFTDPIGTAFLEAKRPDLFEYFKARHNYKKIFTRTWRS